MRGYLQGGPDSVLKGDRYVDAMGMELQVPLHDRLGFSPLLYTWVPTAKVVTTLQHGQVRIWEYFGLVYRDAAVRPRREDKSKADIRLKWWEIEDHMKELGLTLDLHLSVSNSYAEASIDLCCGSDYITLDSKEEDVDY